MTKANRLCRTLLLLLLVLLLAVPAFAAPKIDLDREVSLTVSFTQGETLLSGAEFDLHQVATITENGGLILTETFRPYQVEFSSSDNSNWPAAAMTLSGYVLRDQLTPFLTGKTDPTGRLTLSSVDGKLTPGLYLIIGKDHLQDGKIYFSDPLLVQLPGWNPYENRWEYSLTVSPKPSSMDDPGAGPDEEPETIKRKVLKVWKDAGYTHSRPDHVVVQLLKDGKVYDTVTLNEENHWRYTWEELDKNARWTVVEKEMSGYTVQIRQEGITFVVTNTRKVPHTPTPPTPPTPPDKPHKPTPPTPPTPPETPTPPERPVPPGPSVPTLPQTGQLWWPVPILLAAGLILIIFGLIRRRGYRHEA